MTYQREIATLLKFSAILFLATTLTYPPSAMAANSSSPKLNVVNSGSHNAMHPLGCHKNCNGPPKAPKGPPGSPPGGSPGGGGGPSTPDPRQ